MTFNPLNAWHGFLRLQSQPVNQGLLQSINLKALLLARRERHQEERIVITDHKTHGHKAP